MPPLVTVLQLDTDFPRIAGDVASPATYLGDIEILRVSGASVGQIVSNDPAAIPIAPFEEAIAQARGDVIVTSCGFLSYWQAHLSQLTDKPFISSALVALPDLCARYAPQDILTVTFDAESLNTAHFGMYQTDVIGLPRGSHLRKVIAQNLTALDAARAGREIGELVAASRQPHHKHILLECTNLPPYKSVLAAQTDLPITDILTLIEAARPGTINPDHLNS
ncbi:hypothetical protein L0664_13100 [Octadecabacter sp. G9-8]|uniref:Aspartate/glutamate racemase family protein n=1 Tax=Octadecabacter dasysiphoniae TaxID=2909341 RepID=A0ABS9CXP0_9RHOB|nr:hypothetical protein [Octadecabacter dasysiphoniae]MCF2872007.1 hypothetical protein [Octadecabacter dasysiphoniae]